MSPSSTLFLLPLAVAPLQLEVLPCKQKTNLVKTRLGVNKGHFSFGTFFQKELYSINWTSPWLWNLHLNLMCHTRFPYQLVSKAKTRFTKKTNKSLLSKTVSYSLNSSGHPQTLLANMFTHFLQNSIAGLQITCPLANASNFFLWVTKN